MVGEEVSVAVAEGGSVSVGSGVLVGVDVGPGVGGKSCCAIGSPTRAAAALTEKSKSASKSHFQPAIIWARRSRKKETFRADWIERIPARAASNAPATNSVTTRIMPTSVLINSEIILPLPGYGMQVSFSCDVTSLALQRYRSADFCG
jgi:hypothetical protein